MTVENFILAALQKAVTAAVAASTNAALPVKYVNRNFTKPDNNQWLEVIYIPNNIPDEFWSAGKTYRGLLRLILHWGMDDAGAYAPMKLIESIGEGFAKGTKLTDPDNNVRISINDQPNLMGVIEEAPDMILPLSVRYHFFKA